MLLLLALRVTNSLRSKSEGGIARVTQRTRRRACQEIPDRHVPAQAPNLAPIQLEGESEGGVVCYGRQLTDMTRLQADERVSSPATLAHPVAARVLKDG